MKQYEAVILTLEKLGGVATLGQLNQEVFQIKNCEWKTKTPFASIRRIVQTDKNIYKIKPGLYGLKRLKTEIENRGILVETDKNKDSEEFLVFNHTYYQVLLLIIGKLKGMSTFAPNQDRNKKFINNTPLENYRTLEKIPQFSFPKIIEKSETIDVIWFNERLLPHSFYEVEHSTDFINSLNKFNNLQDFYSRMVMVSDKKRKEDFLKKYESTSFRDLKKNNRVSFLDYDTLIKQYEYLIEQQNYDFIL